MIGDDLIEQRGRMFNVRFAGVGTYVVVRGDIPIDESQIGWSS